MFSVKNLSLSPHSESCTGVTYFLAFCPTCVYKHTQRLRLRPAKMTAHVAKRYHACLTYCDVNSPQGPADPRWSLVEKASRTIQSKRCLSEQVSKSLRAYQKKIFFFWIEMYKIWCIHQTALKKGSIFHREEVWDSKPCYDVTPAPNCTPDLSVVCMSFA